ncbi:putative stringent starvation protein B [Taylorella asinigenitalis 14/45]|uniref:Putative stringent starvation protein B n=1 Tax=Taylorella asinigenitalis 14/45 TaxID=1091495 RepID=I7JN01_9BURK|nr:ClpXP protease specificity-enhancing factor SspB [Taylorella asinigenitalis]CCG19880.1 putative stringent starvation protein B [Taylorella asinigenitalis 14/45]
MFPSSAKGYVVRALHEWCTDMDYDPYILVHTDKNCTVPKQFVQDGLITFNVGYESVKDLLIGNDWISFMARFSGQPMEVSFPLARVAAFYSKQTQEGLMFEVTEFEESNDSMNSEKDMSSNTKSEKEAGSESKDFGGFKIID